MIRGLLILIVLCLGVGLLLGMQIDFGALSDSSKKLVTFPQSDQGESSQLTILKGTQQKVSKIKTRAVSTLEDSEQKIEVIN